MKMGVLWAVHGWLILYDKIFYNFAYLSDFIKNTQKHYQN